MTQKFSKLRESLPLDDRLENERAAARILAELDEQDQRHDIPNSLHPDAIPVKQPLTAV
jgi:hypothetical protein